jgi:multidrug efflux pump subunit AcrB
MRMDTLFFRQPRLVMLALLVILSAGMSALVSIGRQEDPTITNIFATITTVFPGADPARVEALVTAKIETELRTIPEIAEVVVDFGHWHLGHFGRVDRNRPARDH